MNQLPFTNDQFQMLQLESRPDKDFMATPYDSMLAYNSNSSGSAFASASGIETSDVAADFGGNLNWRPLDHASTMGGSGRLPDYAMSDAGSGMTYDNVMNITGHVGQSTNCYGVASKPETHPESAGMTNIAIRNEQMRQAEIRKFYEPTCQSTQSTQSTQSPHSLYPLDCPDVDTIVDVDRRNSIRAEAEAIADAYFAKLRELRMPRVVKS